MHRRGNAPSEVFTLAVFGLMFCTLVLIIIASVHKVYFDEGWTQDCNICRIYFTIEMHNLLLRQWFIFKPGRKGCGGNAEVVYCHNLDRMMAGDTTAPFPETSVCLHAVKFFPLAFHCLPFHTFLVIARSDLPHLSPPSAGEAIWRRPDPGLLWIISCNNQETVAPPTLISSDSWKVRCNSHRPATLCKIK